MPLQLIMKTRARNGVKDNSSEERQFDKAAGIHGAGPDTPQRLNYLNVVYAARQEPLRTGWHI
jgi:hypothetical protein